MGRNRTKRFILENVHTGEIVTGTADEIREKLGVNEKHIYTYADKEHVYKKTWKVRFDEENNSTKKNENLSYSICREWDEVTAMLRKKIQWVEKIE